MTFSQRAVVTSLAVVLMYGGFGFTCPQLTSHLGMDVWNYSDYQRALSRSEQRMAELDDLALRVRQRLSLKILITHDLISKRINLAEATEQFLELNKVKPEAVMPACGQRPAASCEENAAIQVISFARAELNGNPSRCQMVCELEQQLQEMQGGNEEKSE